MLELRELPREHAHEAWLTIVSRIAQPERAYGPRWKDHPRSRERLFLAIEEGATVGLGSIEPYGDREAVLRLCVLPAHTGRGLRVQIRQALTKEAFRDAAVLRVTGRFLLENGSQLARMMRDAAGWQLFGVMWFPPPAYCVFGQLRQDAWARGLFDG